MRFAWGCTTSGSFQGLFGLQWAFTKGLIIKWWRKLVLAKIWVDKEKISFFLFVSQSSTKNVQIFNVFLSVWTRQFNMRPHQSRNFWLWYAHLLLLPWRISNDLPWGSIDISWNHTYSFLSHFSCNIMFPVFNSWLKHSNGKKA